MTTETTVFSLVLSLNKLNSTPRVLFHHTTNDILRSCTDLHFHGDHDDERVSLRDRVARLHRHLLDDSRHGSHRAAPSTASRLLRHELRRPQLQLAASLLQCWKHGNSYINFLWCVHIARQWDRHRDRDRHRFQYISSEPNVLVSVSVQYEHLHKILQNPILSVSLTALLSGSVNTPLQLAI